MQDNYIIYNQQAVYDAVAIGAGRMRSRAYVLTDVNGERNIDGTVAVQTFVNGADMTHARHRLCRQLRACRPAFGPINWSLSANYNENKVDKIAALPSALYASTVDPSKNGA